MVNDVGQKPRCRAEPQTSRCSWMFNRYGVVSLTPSPFVPWSKDVLYTNKPIYPWWAWSSIHFHRDFYTQCKDSGYFLVLNVGNHPVCQCPTFSIRCLDRISLVERYPIGRISLVILLEGDSNWWLDDYTLMTQQTLMIYNLYVYNI